MMILHQFPRGIRKMKKTGFPILLIHAVIFAITPNTSDQ
jgi:hypothetical protein